MLSTPVATGVSPPGPALSLTLGVDIGELLDSRAEDGEEGASTPAEWGVVGLLRP